MARYEFGPSSLSRLAHWLRGAFCRDHHAMACGLCGQAGAGYRPAGSLASFRDPGKRPRGEIASGRQELTCWTRADRAARIEIVTSAARSAAQRRRDKRRLDFRLTMSRWQNNHSTAAIRAARVFCFDARASDRFHDAASAAPSPYFSISSIDAPRGAVGRPCRPPQRFFVRGERVYHGQQNDHRRLAPGRNPGGGSAR